MARPKCGDRSVRCTSKNFDLLLKVSVYLLFGPCYFSISHFDFKLYLFHVLISNVERGERNCSERNISTIKKIILLSMSFSFQRKFNRDGVAPDHTGEGRSWSLKKIKFV